MRSAATLIKADVGVETLAIDLGGWDTHNDQAPILGKMANLMTTLSTGLAAFHSDVISDGTHDTTLVAMTEFGRVVKENGSADTDHGHGGVMMVMGNAVLGGKVLTDWPGLEAGELYQGRDLEVTIDYRDILTEILAKRLESPDLDYVFPDYEPLDWGVFPA
jgi:uncharacterized protein (DUF1501 family)